MFTGSVSYFGRSETITIQGLPDILHDRKGKHVIIVISP